MPEGINCLKRLEFLDLNTANYVVSHATAPFTQTQSIDKCIDSVVNSNFYDSAFEGWDIDTEDDMQIAQAIYAYESEGEKDMSLQISDCTLRDGGYLVNKNFFKTSIKGIIDGLVRAGIDYIETGFLQNKVGGESVVYKNSADVRKYIPSYKGTSEFVGFCDNSRYSVENLDDCDGKSFESLRISFAKHEWKEALKFCTAAKEKGYHVFVQPMDTIGYSADERKELIFAVNEIMPETFAIVDTFGAMHMEDLSSIFRQVDSLLDKKIKIGLHSHNNLNLSNALTEQLVLMATETDRSVAVDGSLLGMARGAGNACTEGIANFLNVKYKKSYDIPVLLDTIEKYILPLKSTVHWGYDLPMFICGAESAHVDNISYLREYTDCNYKEMYEILNLMKLEERKRYRPGYSKTDFTILQKAYDVARRMQ